MKKQLMMAAAVAFTMGTAQADQWLDGAMTTEEIQDYNYEVSMGYDMASLYEFGGNYYDTFVDNTVNLNQNKLFEDGQSTTYYTDTGAETIYQAREGFKVSDVMDHFKANENKNIGFNAEMLRGTNRQGGRFEYRELANGMFQNTHYTDIVKTKRQVRSDLQKFSNFDTVTTTDKWGTRTAPPVEWVGISEKKLLELNKDKLKSYTVEEGNGAWSVANALGISLQELYDANPGLEGRFLSTGEVFTISTFKKGDHIKVKDWDSVDIANGRNAHIKDVDDAMWDARYAEAPTTMGSAKIGHVVQAGDYTGTISRDLSISLQDLWGANEGLQDRYLSRGELLVGGSVVTHNGMIEGYDPIGLTPVSGNTLMNVNSSYSKPAGGYVPPIPGLNW